MTLDETLQRAFETLTGRLRDEIARQFQEAARDIAASARTDREAAVGAAVGEAETRLRAEAGRAADQARRDAERELQARLQLDVASAEARVRDHAEASAREGLGASERLIAAVRTLDRERSLTEILDTLASCAGREIARVGLFIVQADELRGWRFIGFSPAFDLASTIVIPAEESGIIAEAIRTGDAISSDTSGSLVTPTFAALPGGRKSLAVPVTMSGDVIAVLYADEGPGGEAGERPSTVTWPDGIEVLARHAARCLEAATAITAMRALTERPAAVTRVVAPNRPVAVNTAVAPSPSSPVAPGTPSVFAADTAPTSRVPQGDEDDAARRYARLLVSEIKLYHETDVAVGRRERDLGSRLGVEIARARVLYEQRVKSSLGSHGDHFHDELVRTLADGDASLFGQMT